MCLNRNGLELFEYKHLNKGISIHVKMHPNFHLSYSILVCKSKNVMITLQKYQENPLKVSFCFQTGDNIVIYVSTRGHWDCTTLQQYCTTFGMFSTNKHFFSNNRLRMCSKRSPKVIWIGVICCRTDRNLCWKCVFMKIKKNGWTFYFKTR